MKNKHVFKPLDNYHQFLVLGFRSILFFLDLVFLINPSDVFLIYAILIYDFMTVFFYILARLICRERYVIDNEYLTKYRGKKVLFKIRKSDIQQVIARRTRWYAPISCLLALYFVTELFTNVSIVFKNCEILKQDQSDLKGDYLYHGSDCYEWREVMSYHKGKKLCKLIGIELTAYKKPTKNI